MSYIVKVKTECIDKSQMLIRLMACKDQLLENNISLENLKESEVSQICFGSDLHSIKIWIENRDRSIKMFETEIEEIVFDDKEVFTFFNVPIVRKQDLFDLPRINRLSSHACLVKKNSEVLSVFESYLIADKFAKSVDADTIEIFRLH